LLVLASTFPRWRDDPEPGFVFELARRLTTRFNVLALVPSAPGALPRERMDGIEVIRFRYAPRSLETLVNDGGIITNLRRARWKLLLVPCFVISQAWLAVRLLRRRNIDFVHAHWLIPQGLIAAFVGFWAGRRRPFVVTSHGADLYALRGKALNALKRLVIRRAAATTVVSSAMLDELGRIGASIANVQVRPMGVDLSGRFVPSPTVVRTPNEILFVGRLVEKKGLSVLLSAMPQILCSHPSAHLTIAGFGPEEDVRRAQVKSLGLNAHVSFIGAVMQPDLPDVYRRAAVFVAPFVHANSGDREGLGLVAVEAAGCGCPVVVSDLEAIRDVFSEGQARFVRPGVVSALADAICTVLDSPPSADAIENVRESLRQKFDWSIVAEGYASLLESLVQVEVGQQ